MIDWFQKIICVSLWFCSFSSLSCIHPQVTAIKNYQFSGRKTRISLNLKATIVHLLQRLMSYVYFACLSGCLFVCLYLIKVNTTEPKFSVGPHMTTGNVYEWLNFPKLAFEKSLIFIKFKKATKFFIKSAQLLYLF